MSFITDLFSSGASTLVDSVSGILKDVVTTKGEKMQLDNEIKKAEMDYQIQIKTLDIDEEKLSYADTDSARRMEADIENSQNASFLSKNISSGLAIFGVLLVFFLFYIVIFRPDIVNKGEKEILMFILGALTGILNQIYGFYFGSSKQSHDQSVTISKQLFQK